MGRKPKDDFKGFLFIADYIARYGKQPSFQAIADELGYGSKRSVQLLITRLVASERITYQEGIITVVHKSDALSRGRTIRIPILGQVPCGPLEEAVENIEDWVDVSESLAKPRSNYFILRAKGDSMDQAGINSGDLMLIRQQASAENGDIVVALIDGAASVKRFRRDEGFVVLSPESSNRDNKPMVFDNDFVIQGKFITRLPNLR